MRRTAAGLSALLVLGLSAGCSIFDGLGQKPPETAPTPALTIEARQALDNLEQSLADMTPTPYMPASEPDKSQPVFSLINRIWMGQ